MSLHFGQEYERLPSDEQKRLAKFSAEQGADIILGSHPHVLQLDKKEKAVVAFV